MKKNKNLTIILYVASVIALLYACFTMFQSYSTVINYYGADAPKGELILYVISNVFVPLMMAVILYALALMNEFIGMLLPKEEIVVEELVEKTQEENTDEKTEEPVEETQEEITDEKIEKLVEDKIYELKQD